MNYYSIYVERECCEDNFTVLIRSLKELEDVKKYILEYLKEEHGFFEGHEEYRVKKINLKYLVEL